MTTKEELEKKREELEQKKKALEELKKKKEELERKKKELEEKIKAKKAPSSSEDATKTGETAGRPSEPDSEGEKAEKTDKSASQDKPAEDKSKDKDTDKDTKKTGPAKKKKNGVMGTKNRIPGGKFPAVPRPSDGAKPAAGAQAVGPYSLTNSTLIRLEQIKKKKVYTLIFSMTGLVSILLCLAILKYKGVFNSKKPRPAVITNNSEPAPKVSQPPRQKPVVKKPAESEVDQEEDEPERPEAKPDPEPEKPKPKPKPKIEITVYKDYSAVKAKNKQARGNVLSREAIEKSLQLWYGFIEKYEGEEIPEADKKYLEDAKAQVQTLNSALEMY